MAADVHAVAVVADGAGDAADFAGSFEDDGADAGAAEEFEGGGEAGGAGSNDDGSFLQRTGYRVWRLGCRGDGGLGGRVVASGDRG